MKKFKHIIIVLFVAFPLGILADVPVETGSGIDMQSGWVSGASGADQIANLQKQMDALNQLNIEDKLRQLEQSLSDMQTLLQAQGQEIQQLESQQKTPIPQTGSSATTVSTAPVQAAPVQAAPVAASSSGIKLTDQPSIAEMSVYQQAMNQIQNKQYTNAIETMKQYLSKYSADGHYVANAHYWLGQLYAIAGMTDASRQELITVVNNYPQSDKVPDSLLKLGQIAYDNNETAQAKQYWQQIVDQYPDSASAHAAAVQLQKFPLG